MAPVTLIFGATGGIGSALSRRLAQHGHRLVLSARDPDRLAALAEAMDAPTHSGDLLQPETAAQAVAVAAEAYGRVDHVVHAVGSILLKPAHRLSDPEWEGVLALNLTSAFRVLRAGLEPMLRQSGEDGGSFVFCSTSAAQAGLANHEAIAAAKGGLEALVRSAAATYAARSIRINAVAPGLVETPLAAPLLRSGPAREASQRLHPLGRLGQPDDIAQAIHMLIDNTWITGQTLAVDGGLSLKQQGR